MSSTNDYTSIPTTGKLKLKGVQDAKIDKKKKKTSSKSKFAADDTKLEEEHVDRSVMLKQLEDEDQLLTRESRRKMGVVDGMEVGPGAGVRDGEVRDAIKTEAEKKHEDSRRKRLEDRLKKEGVKSHKQRVEELNRYLSGLSEHHDMPRIGPG